MFQTFFGNDLSSHLKFIKQVLFLYNKVRPFNICRRKKSDVKWLKSLFLMLSIENPRIANDITSHHIASQQKAIT